MKRTYLSGLVLGLSAAFAIAVSGCSNNPPPPAPISPEKQAQMQQQAIQQIQNNPNIPADKKASLIAEIQHPNNDARPGPPRAQ